MRFPTVVQGIPCQCEVLFYCPPEPMRVTGTGRGDAIEPVQEEFEYHLLDRKGYRAEWLESKVTDEDASRLLKEYKEVATSSEVA